MVPGDERRAAAAAAVELVDVGLRCFWDRERASGALWTEGYHIAFVPRLLHAVADEPELRARVQACLARPSECPMWDVAYFFRPGARWDGALPTPERWTRQTSFEPDPVPYGRAAFWRSDAPEELASSSWDREVDRGMAAIVPPPP